MFLLRYFLSWWVYVPQGTLAAGPMFASSISMVNDACINAGKKSLGFLNPWLYYEGYPALNDIATGNSPGCDKGFNLSRLKAITGWDADDGQDKLTTPFSQRAIGLDEVKRKMSNTRLWVQSLCVNVHIIWRG
ncbi:hypothetical protein V8B97DRAFT_1916454 [Scleroderma yunnanense]